MSATTSTITHPDGTTICVTTTVPSQSAPAAGAGAGVLRHPEALPLQQLCPASSCCLKHVAPQGAWPADLIGVHGALRRWHHHSVLPRGVVTSVPHAGARSHGAVPWMGRPQTTPPLAAGCCTQMKAFESLRPEFLAAGFSIAIVCCQAGAGDKLTNHKDDPVALSVPLIEDTDFALCKSLMVSASRAPSFFTADRHANAPLV
jgi:hypothetical protein